MASSRRSRRAGEDAPPPALRPGEEAALREAVVSLAALDLAGLRLQWRNIIGGAAPERLPRLLRTRILAYRLQAAALGDLPAAARRALDAFDDRHPSKGAETGEIGSARSRSRPRRIKPGSLLVREWNGHLHRVMAMEEGFAWEGGTYRSLSQVARAITGGHWNGPRFFGLKDPKTSTTGPAEIATPAEVASEAGLSGHLDGLPTGSDAATLEGRSR